MNCDTWKLLHGQHIKQIIMPTLLLYNGIPPMN